jgi:tetratricopeptide (TPR) repeat protein
VAAVFGQTAGYAFVNFDDNEYVYANEQVKQGLRLEGIAWAFTDREAGNWHPLTWMSHMLDCRLYRADWPGGHHLTSVLLHAVTAILLFLLLTQMTGRRWASGLAAAVFALHPLRVESVAWVTERKDVLSGLFFMLTLLAYVGYARRRFSPGRYLAALGCFALGLMAKPMLVTLPGVLLLLDYWPLGRMDTWARAAARILEKLPFLALTAASCVVTLWAQAQGIAPLAILSWASRLANVPAAYLGYLRQFFCPTDLAAFYPYREALPPAWQTVAALLVLAVISVAAWLWRRSQPWFLVGWLWYLGMLVPVIGIVQVGSQSTADRYTYLPEIGLAIALVWGACEGLRRAQSPSPLAGATNVPSVPGGEGEMRSYRPLFSAVAAVLLAVLMGWAWRQTSFWRDSETLWTHTIACTEPNALAHIDFGLALKAQGRLDEAIDQYRMALEIAPEIAAGHNDLGTALAMRGRLEEAVAELTLAAKYDPNDAGIRGNLDRARALLARKHAGRPRPHPAAPP